MVAVAVDQFQMVVHLVMMWFDFVMMMIGDNLVVMVGEDLGMMMIMMIMGKDLGMMMVMGHYIVMGAVLECWAVVRVRGSVQVQSLGMDQVQWFVGMNDRSMVHEIHMGVSRGVRIERTSGEGDLVMVVDMLVHWLSPSWRWLGNWHPLLHLHWSPGLLPMSHINCLGLPRLYPARLPGYLLGPETIGRVLQSNDSVKEKWLVGIIII